MTLVLWPTQQSEGNTIILYVPQSLPAMTQRSEYQADSQPGELNSLKRQIGAAAAGVGYGNDPGQSARSVADSVSAALTKEGLGTGLSAGRQLAMEAVASELGQNATGNLIALGSGKILNPNVEVIYQGPTLRSFNLQFTFAPKDSGEARAIKDILYEFKFWSAAGWTTEWSWWYVGGSSCMESQVQRTIREECKPI